MQTSIRRTRIFLCVCVFGFALICSPAFAGAPVSDFSANVTSGTVPLAVQFTDLSTNSPAGWAWFFGDETYTQGWLKTNGSSGWTNRYQHTSVVMPDGTIVLMGGYDNTGEKNNVWLSTDKGATWMLVNSSAGWTKRKEHTTVVLPDYSIVLMGGKDNSGFKNDVWRSIDYGSTWVQQTSNAGWATRYDHSSVVLPDGSIVLMGGYGGGGPSNFNDVWRSTDNGITWVQQTAGAEWIARSGFSSVVMPDGSIIIMGGVIAGAKNDVWRSTDKGVTWSQINSSAGWAARYYHSSVVMPDGSILLMGGSSNTGAKLNDVWRSTDYGLTWSQVNSSAGWGARYGHTSGTLPDGSVILLGGLGGTGSYNDTWRFQPVGSSMQNTSHTYPAMGTYPVALQAYNALGSNTTLKTGYITANPAITTGSVHNLNTSLNYTSISTAVNAATRGDTILVDSGLYKEYVTIFKQLTLRGVDTGTGYPVVDAMNADTPLWIAADGVTIDSFTVMNGTWNVLSSGGGGIVIGSHDAVVSNITTRNNSAPGIYVKGDVFGVNNSKISHIHTENNTWCGIYAVNASFATFTGIDSTNNQGSGITLSETNSSTVVNTTLLDNWNHGIALSISSKNIVKQTIIQNNSISGIYVYYGNDNRVYDNKFSNTNNTLLEGVNLGNIWNTTKTLGTNIINGPYLGGNFWGNLSGTGFSETHVSTRGDGIADSSFIIAGSDIDYLPLVSASIVTSGTVHNQNTGINYTTIQAAINAASPLDTIIIDSGRYNESLNVTKPLTLRGADTGTGYPVIDAMKMGTPVTIPFTSHAAQLANFTITNSTGSAPGLDIQSNNNTIFLVTVRGNKNNGITISGKNNTVSFSQVSDNLDSGFFISGMDNTVSLSQSVNNTGDGYVILADNNTITGSTASGCQNGITIQHMPGNTVLNAVINSSFTANQKFGINLYMAENTTITGNRITGNRLAGITLSDSVNTHASNNIFNNTNNTLFYPANVNSWNITKTAGTNIIGGNWTAGNYWAQPDGLGFSETHADTTGDGIADDPYTLQTANIDYLPLTNLTRLGPVANFTATPTYGTAPLVVQFTDTSTNTPTSWNWSFGDGMYSNEQNASHTFTPGIFSITLNATNTHGRNVSTRTAFIHSNFASPVMFRNTENRTGVYSDGGTRPGNSLKWNFNTGGDVHSSPAISNGILYVGSNDGRLYALNTSTGAERWRYSFSAEVRSSPAVANGIVFIGTNDHNLYALNASTGAKIWNFTTGDNIIGSPALADGTVYIGSADNRIYALNPTTGEKFWDITTGLYVDSSPAVLNGSVFVGSWDHKVYAFNASTGSLIWDFTTGNAIEGSPAIVNNTVFIGSDDNNLYAIHAVTGNKIWNYSTGGYVFSSPAVSGGVVYVGSDDKNVYALDAVTGVKLWNFTAQNAIRSSPAIANGVLYVGSHDGRLYALNTTTGEKLWDYLTEEWTWVESSPAVSEGVVYFGGDTDKVYALHQVVPVANFTANVTSGTVPLSVRFTDTSTGSPTVWYWSFGDLASDNTSTLQHPVHTYGTTGNFTVSLNVTNSAGSSVTIKMGYITVNSPLTTGPVHNLNSGMNYTGIQLAVDNASAFDLLLVDSGHYPEIVNITRPLTLRGNETGTGPPVIDPGTPGVNTVITLSADNITLDWFVARNARDGLHITGSNETLHNITATQNNVGISFYSSNKNLVTRAEVSNNTNDGFTLVSSSDTTIERSRVHANSGTGITGVESVNITLTDTVIDFNRGYGLYLKNSAGNTVNGNNLSTNDYGISLEHVKTSTFSQNFAGNNSGKGIYLDDTNGCVFTRNDALLNGDVGINLYNTSRFNGFTENRVMHNVNKGFYLDTAHNNTFTRDNASFNSYGFSLYNSNNNTFTGVNATYQQSGISLANSSGNTFSSGNIVWNNIGGIGMEYSEGNRFSGITLAGNNEGFFVGALSNNNVFLSNTIVNSTSQGITLYQHSGSVLSGNVIRKGSTGLKMDAAVHSSVSNNEFVDNSDYGILIETGGLNTFSANNASWNGIAGINIGNSSGNLFTGMKIDTNGYGVMHGNYSSNTTFSGNTVSNNSAYAFEIERSSNVTIVDSTIRDNNQWYQGAVKFGESKNITVNRNRLENNHEAGIRIAANSTMGTVTNNTIRGHTLAGIMVEYATANAIFNNTLSGSDYGFKMDTASFNTISHNWVDHNSHGAMLVNSSENLFFDNAFNNTINVQDDGNNTWNTTKQAITSIIGKPYRGGNYWSNYIGVDTTGDGIGTTILPYTNAGAIIFGGDWLPLTNVTGTLPPVANFTANVTAGVAPLAVQFLDNSTGSPTDWNWSFGDGSVSAIQSPVHTYLSSGTYTVLLNATNTGGSNVTTRTNYITVTIPAPVANFTANVTAGVAPLVVQFLDNSTGSPTDWNWSFGDGNYSTDQNPSHFYLSIGSFNVSLNASNAGGSNTTTHANYIIVYPSGIVANFTANVTTGLSPLTVQFTDLSAGSPTEWNWSFGDGNYSKVKDPVHTFMSSGYWTVNLSIKNTGGSDTLSRSGYVQIYAGEKQASANIIGMSTTYSGTVQNVTLNMSVINGQVQESGTQVTLVNPGSGWNMVILFATDVTNIPGTLVATNITGANLVSSPVSSSLTGTGLGTVSAGFSAGFPRYPAGQEVSSRIIEGATQPMQDSYVLVAKAKNLSITGTGYSLYLQTPPGFNANITPGSAKVTMTFDHGWMMAHGGMNRIRIFRYDDLGFPSLLASRWISYNATTDQDMVEADSPSGFSTFTVAAVTDSGGNTTVAPVADFSANTTAGNIPVAVQFVDYSTNTPTSWQWTFGDGASSTEQNPVHVYTATGTYTVSLTATNAAGSSVLSRPNYVSAKTLPPIASFTANGTWGAVPYPVRFIDTSTNQPTSWNWTFGDGAGSTVQNPVHTYTTPGNYTVTLGVKNPWGSSTSSAAGMIYVGLAPIVKFTFAPQEPTENETVAFNASASYDPDGNITAYSWNFDDGTVAPNLTIPTIAHNFTEPRVHNVTLTVLDNKFLKNSTMNQVSIFAKKITVPTDINGTVVNTTPSGEQELTMNATIIESTGGNVTYTNTTVTVERGSEFWLTTQVFGQNVTRTLTGNLTVQNVTEVVLGSAPITAALNETIGNVSVHMTLALDKYVPDSPMGVKILEGANISTMHGFQIAAQNANMDLRSIAYTIEISNTNRLNTNLTTNASRVPVVLTMTVKHSWVHLFNNGTNNDGRGSVVIIRYPEIGNTQVLTTRFTTFDENSSLDSFEADSDDGLSIFGMIGYQAQQAAAQQSSGGQTTGRGGARSSTGTYPVATLEPGKQYPPVKQPDIPKETVKLRINEEGLLITSVQVQSTDNGAYLTLPEGTRTVDRANRPLPDVSIVPVNQGNLPPQEPGSQFTFGGLAYQCSPDGARFSPAITLTFTPTSTQWASLIAGGREPVVRGYNIDTGIWESVPAGGDPGSQTVTAQISHFSTYALFSQPSLSQTGTSGVTPTPPAQKPPANAFEVVIGMGMWAADQFVKNIVIGICIIVACVAGYVWWQRRSKYEWGRKKLKK